MNEARTTSQFCPSCQSPLVNFSALAGGEASCESCKWKGKNEDLLTHAFQSGFTDPNRILNAFVNDIKILLSKDVAKDIGRLIIKWGFVDTVDVKTLSRFVSAIARGIALSVLEERRVIEKERHNG